MTSSDTPTWTVRANFWRGWRALGGSLSLGVDALEFRPHAVERALGGGTSYRAEVRDVAGVEVARRGLVPRRRLFVRTRDGGTACFLVPRVEERADDLRAAAGIHATTWGPDTV